MPELSRFFGIIIRMPHPIHKVTAFKKLAPYALCIRFADNTEQTIDFRPILAGDLYGPLQDLVVFEQVRIDPEVSRSHLINRKGVAFAQDRRPLERLSGIYEIASTLVWPNGADFDPAVLHDWPAHQAAFVTRARQWATTGAEVR